MAYGLIRKVATVPPLGQGAWTQYDGVARLLQRHTALHVRRSVLLSIMAAQPTCGTGVRARHVPDPEAVPQVGELPGIEIVAVLVALELRE